MPPATEHAIDWRQVLKSRKGRRPGFMRGHLAKSALLDIAPQDIQTDDDQWSAEAVISTPTPDRAEDIVHPTGIVLNNYAKNPIVLFDHGFSGIVTPIGVSEGPDGVLAITPSEQNVVAKTFFNKDIPESRQIFELIRAKFIRTTSVNFEPLEAQLRKGFPIDQFGNGPLEVFNWELLEYSWVVIPCNPEATRKLLDARKINGERLSEPILKSFAPFAAPVPKTGRGFTPPKRPAVAKSRIKSDDDFEDDPAAPADDTTKNEDLPAPDEGMPADGTTPADTEAPADEPQSDADKPLGQQVAQALYDNLNSTITQVESAMGPLENPTIKEHLGTLLDSLRGCAEELKGVYSSAYPDADELAPTTADDDAMLKNYLVQSQMNRLQVSGLAGRLKTLRMAKNLKPDQRALLDIVSGRLTKMAFEAKKAPVANSADTQMAAVVAELKAEVLSLTKRFKELLPAA